MQSSFLNRYGVILGVLFVVALCFGTAAGFEFVLVDDPVNVFANPHYHPFDASSVHFFWTEPYNALYAPLTATVWGILSGGAHLAEPFRTPSMGYTDLDPFVFHAANLLFHGINTLLVFGIANRLLPRPKAGAVPWQSGIAALFYGLHPAQVESVAWVTGFNNVLSGTFALLSLYLYIRFLGDYRKRFYLGAALCFVCAVLAKPTVAAFPLGLAALAIGFAKAPARRTALQLLPWLVVAGALVIATQKAQLPQNRTFYETPLWQRPFIAGDALAFYLAKIAAPLRLGFDYGRNPAAIRDHWWGYVTTLAPVALLVLLAVLARRAPNAGRYLSLLLLLIACVLPMLGFVPFYYQPISTVADRYLYLALLAPALALGLLFQEAKKQRAVGIALAVYLVCLGARTVLAVPVWRNSETLYANLLAVNPRSAFGYQALGDLRRSQNRAPDAIDAYSKALAIDPKQVPSRVQRAFLLGSVGRFPEAESDYRQVLRDSPHLPEAESNLGQLLAMQRRFAEAEPLLQDVVRTVPDDPLGHFVYGKILMMDGTRDDEAIAEYQRGLELKPGVAQAEADLKTLMERQRK